jgi:hypothetical protein
MLWEQIKNGEYDVYISDVTFEDITACSEPKQTELMKYLAQINFTTIENTQETKSFAAEIINAGYLKQKSYDDCQHIACAVLADCDIILSWNFKHLVNAKTIGGVKHLSFENGYKHIEIYSPAMIVYEKEKDNEKT